MKQLTLLLLGVIFLSACKQRPLEQAENIQEALPTVNLQNYAVYGDTISPDGPQDIAELPGLLANAGTDSLQLTLKATVINSCKMKGCFMNVRLPDEAQMRVSFKNYSFFVPKDLSGEAVILKGTAFTSITDVETLRHMAEDAGAAPEVIDTIQSPKMEYRFIADGVLIARD